MSRLTLFIIELWDFFFFVVVCVFTFHYPQLMYILLNNGVFYPGVTNEEFLGSKCAEEKLVK